MKSQPVSDWKLYLPQAIDKYNFLVERWRKTLSQEQKILFVRVEYNWTPEKAVELRDLFTKHYPLVDSYFLLAGEAAKPYYMAEDWQLEKIITAHFPPPFPLDPPVPLPMGNIPPMDSGAKMWKEVLLNLNSVNSQAELPSYIDADY